MALLLADFCASLADFWPPRRLFRASGGENRVVDFARVWWLVTVVACLVAVLILVLEGYIGYAGITLAVGISAAVNLF